MTLKRYDIASNEFVELTQEYFDDLNRKLNAMASHYKNNSPENFKNFCDECRKAKQ